MVNLEEQIKMLVELQGLDTQIFRLEDELASVPEKTKTLDDSFKAKTAELKKIEDNVKALQLKRKEKEIDLETREGTIKKYQTQMYQVKTNKEYTAFQEEIGRVKADNSIIEEEIIKIFDQIDAENKKMVVQKEALKSDEAVVAAEKKKLADDAGRIKAELDGLKGQRSALAAKVDKTILSKYERIIRSKDRLAVVTIADDACQGCHRILPPQVINEVKMKKDLVFCENCARILYLEE